MENRLSTIFFAMLMAHFLRVMSLWALTCYHFPKESRSEKKRHSIWQVTGYQNIVQQYMNEINKGIDGYILEHAKKLITDFCLKEYNCEGDFSDLTYINIAYTCTSDEEIPIQIVVDLVHCEMKCYLSGELFRTRTYDSLGDLTAAELEYLNFDELVSLTNWEGD